MSAIDWVSAAASTATVVGVAAVAWQVHQAEQHQRAGFELRFSDRYDDYVARIPLSVLLDESEYDPASADVRRAFYDYFELCEQECYYRDNGEISNSTWKDWLSGIEGNRRKRSFVAAWNDLCSVAPEQFETFRRMFPLW